VALVAPLERRSVAMSKDATVTSDLPRLTADETSSPMLLRLVAWAGRRWPRLADPVDTISAIGARFGRHRGGILAAGFAYFALLAIVPAAIALGSVAVLLGSPEALNDALDRAVERVPSLGGSAESVLRGLITVVDSTSSASFGITTVVALLIALYAASRVLVTASQVLDLAFDRPPRERSWLVRIVSAVIVLVLLVALVAALVIVQALPRLREIFGLAGSSWATTGVQALVLIGIVYVIFAAAYRVGAPREARVPWWNGGAVIATIGVLIGTIGTAIYVQLSAQLGAAIAVLGGALVLQLWLYVVGLSLVAGAELEAILAKRTAS
jgi:membrane protein